MLRSMYIASTGMQIQRLRMNVLTNNIANVQTAGFKNDRLISSSFREMMLERLNDPSIVGTFNEVGNINLGVHVDEVVTDFSSGGLEGTGRMGDFALQGSGFFVIQTAEGDRYTRDGSFSVDQAGYLVTADGNYVTGQNGKIYIGDNEFAVNQEGEIFVDDVQVDQLKIVSFLDTAALRKEGNNLYNNFGGTQVTDSEDTLVLQGYLEGSNVNMVDTMVDLMAVSQAYGTNQSILKMIDQTLDKTVNEVGRV